MGKEEASALRRGNILPPRAAPQKRKIGPTSTCAAGRRTTKFGHRVDAEVTPPHSGAAQSGVAGAQNDAAGAPTLANVGHMSGPNWAIFPALAYAAPAGPGEGGTAVGRRTRLRGEARHLRRSRPQVVATPRRHL